MDGDAVGQANADTTWWWTATPGMHEIRVVDTAGRAARIPITVGSADGI